MKEIPLTRGRKALVDDDDFEAVAKHKWHCLSIGYAARSVGTRKIKTMVYMHRMIIGALKGELVDHVDGNKLNNQKSNLRLCSPSQNSANYKKTKPCSSKHRGVTKLTDGRKKCWMARIKINYKSVTLGRFHSEDEAARAYDSEALKIWGEFATLNFPRK